MIHSKGMIQPIKLACGAYAVYDHSTGYAYRCATCNAVVGSVGMPQQCAEAHKAAQGVPHVHSRSNRHAHR